MKNFVSSDGPLFPKDAVAAIILDEEDSALLQLRDNVSQIFFPNHWGLFGGAIEDGECHLEALNRELLEELSLNFNEANVEPFMSLRLPFGVGKPTVLREVYTVRTTKKFLSGLNLNEGQKAQSFNKQDCLRLSNLTPYDEFSLWCYFNKHRIDGPSFVN